MRRTPVQRVEEALVAALGPEAQRIPRGYERLGDVLVVDLPLPEPEAEVAEAYAGVLGMRTVLGREGRIRGELRQPTHRFLWGDPDTRTLHREGGIQYRLDAARIMWSAGNRRERERVAAWTCKGETVVDLFAGVGYFTLPLAVHGHAQCVIAIEKNPESAAFLRENVTLNGVDERVEVREGDCRDVAPVGVADRVLLGYLPDSIEFLGVAARALRGRGRLHVHRAVGATAGLEGARLEVVQRLESLGCTVHEAKVRTVKSYGPRTVHAVVDVDVTP